MLLLVEAIVPEAAHLLQLLPWVKHPLLLFQVDLDCPILLLPFVVAVVVVLQCVVQLPELLPQGFLLENLGRTWTAA